MEKPLENQPQLIDFESLRNFTFSPANLYWKRRSRDVKILSTGDVVDIDKLKKFKEQLYFTNEKTFDASEFKDAFLQLQQEKHEIKRRKVENDFAYWMQEVFWKGSYQFRLIDVVNVFHQYFAGDISHLLEVSQVDQRHFLLCAYKGSLSCALAAMLGLTRYELLKDLYLANFYFYRPLYENFNREDHRLLTDITQGEGLWSKLKTYQVLEGELKSEYYPLIEQSFFNLLELGQFQNAAIIWKNFNTIDEVIFFVQKVFHGDDVIIESVGKVILNCEYSTQGLLKNIIYEYEINHSRCPQFFAVFKKRFQGKKKEERQLGA